MKSEKGLIKNTIWEVGTSYDENEGSNGRKKD